MKKFTFLLVMLFAWVATSSSISQSTRQPKSPNIAFVSKVYDFGTISEAKGPVTCEFKFTNKGDAPLVIVSATAGCGCTKPAFDGEPIAPGKSSAISVTYNPKGRLGEFNKNITVRTNDPKNKKVVLKISGLVVE